ncbi:MAG: PQQ-binding-like beta-propeller repeat protein [Polyangiaceae bacterium]|nr:PQQ-binding-like beta-propeller repeat protein [Polyangiaceae bacterium]
MRVSALHVLLALGAAGCAAAPLGAGPTDRDAPSATAPRSTAAPGAVASIPAPTGATPSAVGSRMPAVAPAPASGVLWRSRHVTDVLLLKGATWGYDHGACELFGLDLATGAVTSPPVAIAPGQASRAECPTPLGDALLRRDSTEDVVVDALTQARRFSVPRAHLPYSGGGTSWEAVGGVAVVAVDAGAGGPPSSIQAFALADGRAHWSVPTPPGERPERGLTADRERVYVLLQPPGGGPGHVAALRLRDGSLAWQLDTYRQVFVGPAGVALDRDGVTLVDPATGTPRWRHAVRGNVVRAVVGEREIHLIEPASEDLVTLASSDGHELWRAKLPARTCGGMGRGPRLLLSRGHVFHVGCDSVVGLLSGFDAATGEKTLAYAVHPEPDVGVARGALELVFVGGGLAPAPNGIGYFFDPATTALDPATPLVPHTVTATGRLTHAAASGARRLSFAGLEVCSPTDCTRADAAGRFTLTTRARGRVPIWLRVGNWIHDHAAQLVPPPSFFSYACPARDNLSLRIDAESDGQAEWSPEIDVQPCPND